jgi:hypothetical protein
LCMHWQRLAKGIGEIVVGPVGHCLNSL